MQMNFFLTEFISKISGNLRFFGLGGSPKIDATSCRTMLSVRMDMDSPM